MSIRIDHKIGYKGWHIGKIGNMFPLFQFCLFYQFFWFYRLPVMIIFPFSPIVRILMLVVFDSIFTGRKVFPMNVPLDIRQIPTRRNFMKKYWLVAAALILGSSLTYGYDTEIRNETAAEQAAIAQEEASSLTPRRPQTIIRAQQPSPSPAPSVIPDAPRLAKADAAPAVETTYFSASEPATSGNDDYIYAELNRLSAEIQQLKKNPAAAGANPKKSFSTPKLAGRMFFDAWAGPDYDNRAGLNELRFSISGTGYEVFDYKAEFALTSALTHTHAADDVDDIRTGYVGQVTLVDAWIGAKNVPGLGYFRAGHYNVETGLSYMSGSINTTLTNVHPSSQSFNLARKFGCSSEHLFANDRVRWFYGFFQGYNTNNGYNSSARALAGNRPGLIFNTRLTMAPYYADGGRCVFHIGGHYSYIHDSTQHNQIAAYGGGNNWFGPATLSTGYIDVLHHNRGGLEFAYQNGPFRVQVEPFIADFGKFGTATGTTTEFAYFLTGEHRAYNLSAAIWGAPTVKRPFRPFKCGDWNLVDGWGAWQVVARHSYTDLDNWYAVGGYQNDWTLGMNWFWTPNVRCIFEYTHSTQNVGAKYFQDVFGTSIRVNF